MDFGDVGGCNSGNGDELGVWWRKNLQRCFQGRVEDVDVLVVGTGRNERR